MLINPREPISTGLLSLWILDFLYSLYFSCKILIRWSSFGSFSLASAAAWASGVSYWMTILYLPKFGELLLVSNWRKIPGLAGADLMVMANVKAKNKSILIILKDQLLNSRCWEEVLVNCPRICLWMTTKIVYFNLLILSSKYWGYLNLI